MDFSRDIKKWIIFGIVFIVIIIIVGGVMYGSVYRMLPGDAGYGFKVNYIEESLEVLRPSAALKANYHITVLERRLRDAERMAEDGQIGEGDLWYFKDETVERSKELIALLAKEEGAQFAESEVLDYNHRLLTILRAIETVVEEAENLALIEEDVEDIRREAYNSFNDRAEQFVERHSEEEIRSYISDLLGKALSYVDGRTLNRRLRDNVGEYIERAERDIGETEAAGAIQNIGNALTLIQVAEYLGTTEVEPAMPAREEQNGSTTESENGAAATLEATSSIQILE